MNYTHTGTKQDLRDMLSDITDNIINESVHPDSPLMAILGFMPPHQKRSVILGGALRVARYMDSSDNWAHREERLNARKNPPAIPADL
jgi:hypothetical protein